jgi:hypothetical protein
MITADSNHLPVNGIFVFPNQSLKVHGYIVPLACREVGD